MKISILHFWAVPENDLRISASLEASEIKTTRVQSLSRLHMLIACRTFDAIIIHEHYLKLHGMSPYRHLWQSGSPLCIISYTIQNNGKIELQFARLSQKITEIPDKSDREIILNRIAEILESGNTFTNDTPEKPINMQNLVNDQKILLPDNLQNVLHKKIKLVLSSLINAGNAGIPPENLTYEVWGSTQKNKKKDIQIYISKLRTLLKKSYDQKYQISLNNGRYILSESNTLLNHKKAVPG